MLWATSLPFKMPDGVERNQKRTKKVQYDSDILFFPKTSLYSAPSLPLQDWIATSNNVPMD